jgi:UDP-glucose 4-epimerase
VIPLFLEALRSGTAAIIHGDGRQSRAFNYVDDVVAANLAAASAPATACSGRAYNIGGDRRVDLLELLETMAQVVGTTPRAVHTEVRAGDIRHSEADLSAVGRDLGWKPQVELTDGLRRTEAWFAARTASDGSRR